MLLTTDLGFRAPAGELLAPAGLGRIVCASSFEIE